MSRLSEQGRIKVIETNKKTGTFKRYNQIRSSLPGYVNPMKGKKRPDLLERNLKGKDNGFYKTRKLVIKSGKEHPAWKKDKVTPLHLAIRHLLEYRQWRSDVFSRDEFMCQDCGAQKCHLHAHHIVQFAKIILKNNIKTTEDARLCEELWNINNGETLCIPCHKKIPAKRVGDGS